jgi:hypothetical protein
LARHHASLFTAQFSPSNQQNIGASMLMAIAMKLLLLTTTLLSCSDAFVTRPTKHMTTHLNAVSKKDSYSITLLPGDGIGPEITKATKTVLERLCQRFDFTLELKEALIGGAAIDACNDPFPPESLEQCQASDSVLLACIGGYKVCRHLVRIKYVCTIVSLMNPYKICLKLYSGTIILVN